MKRSSRYVLRYGPPRISCEDMLKRSGLTTLEKRRYNPGAKNYQWERSTTVGEVFVLAPNTSTRRHRWTY